jgi:hypothetical protein
LSELEALVGNLHWYAVSGSRTISSVFTNITLEAAKTGVVLMHGFAINIKNIPCSHSDVAID